jgi:hypothetical protein
MDHAVRAAVHFLFLIVDLIPSALLLQVRSVRSPRCGNGGWTGPQDPHCEHTGNAEPELVSF